MYSATHGLAGKGKSEGRSFVKVLTRARQGKGGVAWISGYRKKR